MALLRRVLLVLLIVGTGMVSSPLADRSIETSAGRIRVETVANGLVHPWGLAFLPDGRMLVTERPGRLRIVDHGQLLPPVAGVPAVFAEGQGGLLDVAVDPAYAANRLIYFSYAEPGPEGAGTAVARARLGDNRLEDIRFIFRQQPRISGDAHFGSRLVFAPDGTLIITLGERNRRDMAQNLENHLGKIVRIHPDGSVPPDNPFIARTGAKPEIWSLGHRNIQAAALHPKTRALWIVEHGARGGDEINAVQRGKNYGWPVISYGRHYDGSAIGEGTAKAGLEQPLHYWDPSIAPSGMAFYTSERIPAWKGSLFVGALKNRALVRLDTTANAIMREERLLSHLGERIRDVRQGPDGHLYVLTDNPAGRILRLEAIPPH